MNDTMAAKTPMSDHVARFWRHLETETVRILVDLRREVGHDAPDGPSVYWDGASFGDDVAKALVADRRALSSPEPTEGQIAMPAECSRVMYEAFTAELRVPEIGWMALRRGYKAMATAARAMPLQDHGWQPIESAPRTRGEHKNESDIDLWHKKQGRLADCFWTTDDLPSHKGAWFSRSGGRAFNMGADEAFSHWMPKPTAPAMVAEQGTKS